MATANLGGNAFARKSSHTAFDSSVTSSPSEAAAAKPPALPAELTAAILRLVKAATQGAMCDVAGAPNGSVVAGPAPAADEPTPTAPAAPTDTPVAIQTAEPPVPAASALRSIAIDELEPVVVIASREERAELGRHPLLQSSGFYAGLWDSNRSAYPGMGENVGGRASSNPELGGASPAERTVCIADRHRRLTAQQALVGERLLGQMLQQPGGYCLRNKLPDGAPVEPADYDTMRVFVARACVSLRAAGVLFTNLPAAALLLPPAKAPPFRPLEADTPIYRLAVPSLRAHVAEEDGEWRLLAGAEVRAEVQPSAFGPASMARAELLHAGGLLRTGATLSTTRDLRFSSAWAAAHFVLGQKPRSDVWKLIPAAADASGPRA
jgi:hypothetical protein